MKVHKIQSKSFITFTPGLNVIKLARDKHCSSPISFHVSRYQPFGLRLGVSWYLIRNRFPDPNGDEVRDGDGDGDGGEVVYDGECQFCSAETSPDRSHYLVPMLFNFLVRNLQFYNSELERLLD
jgi:hypothetical protein